MSDINDPALRAFALNCSLRPSDSDQQSSTDRMISDLLTAMRPHGITGKTVRLADYNVKPGVLSDMGAGDDWPKGTSKNCSVPDATV